MSRKSLELLAVSSSLALMFSLGTLSQIRTDHRVQEEQTREVEDLRLAKNRFSDYERNLARIQDDDVCHAYGEPTYAFLDETRDSLRAVSADISTFLEAKEQPLDTARLHALTLRSGNTSLQYGKAFIALSLQKDVSLAHYGDVLAWRLQHTDSSDWENMTSYLDAFRECDMRFLRQLE